MLRPAIIVIVCAMAASLPAQAENVEDVIASFIHEDGYIIHDVDAVEAELAQTFLPSDGAMRPDQYASAIEKALLLVGAMEQPLPHSRYMVRYGQIMQGETPVSLVTVERYNMGPALWQATASAFGEEDTADPEVFGIGPHVAWRIVSFPVMGQAAAIMQAARRELSDNEAAETDCGGRGCLSDHSSMDSLYPWQTSETSIDIATAYPSVYDNGLSIPAFAAADLLTLAGLIEADGGFPYWRGPEQPEASRFGEPFLFVGIDFNLGQDDGVDAMLGQTLLNDDALEEIWFRRVQFPDASASGQIYWMRAAVERSR